MSGSAKNPKTITPSTAQQLISGIAQKLTIRKAHLLTPSLAQDDMLLKTSLVDDKTHLTGISGDITFFSLERTLAT